MFSIITLEEPSAVSCLQSYIQPEKLSNVSVNIKMGTLRGSLVLHNNQCRLLITPTALACVRVLVFQRTESDEHFDIFIAEYGLLLLKPT
jgi:hypothetical protein